MLESKLNPRKISCCAGVKTLFFRFRRKPKEARRSVAMSFCKGEGALDRPNGRTLELSQLALPLKP